MNVVDKVLELRKLVIKKIDKSFKEKTYWKTKYYISSQRNTLPIKNCIIFDIGDFFIMFGEVKHTTIGGSYIIDSNKPIIWFNTWMCNTWDLPLIFKSQYKRLLNKGLFILDHELTHYVDDKYNRAIVPVVQSRYEYYNSTLEVNAYFCQIILSSKNFKEFYHNLCTSYFIQNINIKNKKRMINRGYLYFN
jgi:hypothetical protein